MGAGEQGVQELEAGWASGPRLKAGMGLRLGHKKAKSGFPPSPNHEVSFALGGMGETHSSTQVSASWEDTATWLMPRLGQGLV